MAVAFAAKLRMAAAAVGCTSRKEICARFRAVNPATECDLDRLNKWMQGRSEPRAPSVHDDLAQLIGSSKTGRWVAECSLDEFAIEVAARTGVDAATLTAPGDRAARGASRAYGLFGGINALAGTFAAYSPAWSPHFAGSFVRGALRLAPARSGGLLATYSESVMGRDMHMTAEAEITGRSLHLALAERETGLPVFISTHLPGPPASILCGVMSGVALVAHDPLPSACRIIFIRVPDNPNLNASNRYFEPKAGAIASDLAALGLNLKEAARLDAKARDFLRTVPEQVSSRDQSDFATLLDRESLAVSFADILALHAPTGERG